MPAATHSGKSIHIPLSSILSTLPLELQPRLLNSEVGEITVPVTLEKILSQLSRGSVKISFADLRNAAPGYFSSAADKDRVLVPLPLNEILPKLNPALITRRRAQRVVEVPDHISSPFDPANQTPVFAAGPEEAEPAPATLPPAFTAPRQVTPGPFAAPAPATAQVSRKSINFAPAPEPPTALPANGVPAIPFSNWNGSHVGATKHAAAQVAVATQPPAPVQAPPRPAVEPLLIQLTALAEGWPDAVRQEIVQLNLVEAKVGLPTDVIDRALRQGRIAFTWKMLRSWVRPSPPPLVSVHDSTVLDLPLKVVAPVFLARQQEKVKPQTVLVDEEIPNLFFGFPQGGDTPEPSTNPADSNYYVWEDGSDTVRVDSSEVKRQTPGTKFVNKYATPNEIVSRTASLEGVAGALISLPDGLMVASRLSGELNGETLAAFLPQIFGKVSQCTKELRMGELNNLNFTVGNVPWKIFRVNAIFFAALGVDGMPLPTGQLAAMAAELDHKPK